MKCPDGVCRKDCSNVRSSACPFEQPLRCPDGTCVKMRYECASTRCSPDYFYSCPDNTCRGEISQCQYPKAIRIIKYDKVVSNSNFFVANLHDLNDKLVGYLTLEDRMVLHVKGLALSELSESKLDFERKYLPVFLNFFSLEPADVPAYKFIRSAVVKISTSLDSLSKLKYTKPVKLQLHYDELKPLYKYDEVENYVS